MLSHRRRQEAAHEAAPHLLIRAKINLRQFVFSRPANQRLALHWRERYVTSKQVGIVVGQENESSRTCAAWPLLPKTHLDATFQDVVERGQLSSGFDARSAILW